MLLVFSLSLLQPKTHVVKQTKRIAFFIMANGFCFYNNDFTP